MQNPVTGSGGMLVGVVDEVGPESPLGLAVGDRVATLVSLTLTPLAITDGLRRWDGRSEQVPAEGSRDPVRPLHRGGPARRPADELAMAVHGRVRRAGADRPGRRGVRRPRRAADRRGHRRGRQERLAVAGRGPARGRRAAPSASSRSSPRRPRCATAGLADEVALADARDPVALAAAVEERLGGPADVTVVCVDVPGCEHGAILATADGGTVIFFSMATSFSAAALGAEGLAADVTMLVGNGYVPGHAGLRPGPASAPSPASARLFEGRMAP